MTHEGGYVKPANRREDRADRRFAENQSGKRKVVAVIRERGGNTLPGVFKSEGQALSFLRWRRARWSMLTSPALGTIFMRATK
jgi:hypothetical protein